MGVPKKFQKPCRDCDDLFMPKGKYSLYCKDCLKKRIKIRTHKMKMSMRENNAKKG